MKGIAFFKTTVYFLYQTLKGRQGVYVGPVFLFLLFSYGARSQNISLDLKNASIETAFKQIQAQSNHEFVYTLEVLHAARPVTIKLTKTPLTSALSELFAQQPLVFTMEEKYIVVKEKAGKLAPVLDEVKGRVVTESGTAVSGATVTLKGSSTSTSTNEIGEFSLQHENRQGSLIITSIGYESREIPLQGKTFVEVKLQVHVSTLDETIVIAYGTTTRRFNTGSVSKVSADVIATQPVGNPLSAIQGRSPGVFVTTKNGLPGGNIKVEVRGKGSITAGSEPLYIVDGVPFSPVPLNQGLSDFIAVNGEISPLNSINPLDIESIEILKDADATAIYGSRGANGVILITTKKGKEGKTKADINVSHGISTIIDFPKLLNLRQYLQLRREGFANDGVLPTAVTAPDLLSWDTTKATNWGKYTWGHAAHVTNVQSSISGGDANTNFLISGNFRSEGTVVGPDEKYQRAGGHASLQHTSFNKKLQVAFSVSYTADQSRLAIPSSLSPIGLAPHFPIYDVAGNLNWVGATENPVANSNRRSKSQTGSFVSHTSLNYKILPGLVLKTTVGYSTSDLRQILTIPKFTRNPSSFLTSNSAAFGNNRTQTLLVEPQVNYHKTLDNGTLDVLAGGSWQKTLRTGEIIKAADFANEGLLESLAAAGRFEYTNSIYNEYKYASVFGRINYIREKKYILNASMRRDGSSRFGPGRQFGNFGAVGMGWIFSAEPFVRKSLPFLSYGKLRASYGVSGNDQIQDYQYLSTYSSGVIYQGVTGLAPSVIANDLYGWETNKKLETALEIGLFKDRFLLTVSWYRNKSGNQLVSFPLPYQTGFSSYQANLPAQVGNTGLETDLSVGIIKQKDLSWDLSFNITKPKNKLLAYPGLQSSAYAGKYVVGEDLDIVKGYRYLGVDPATGLAQYDDINKDGKISQPQDFVVIGKTSPDYFGGLGQQVKYKSVAIDIFFQFVKQRSRGAEMFPGNSRNQFTTVLNRWQSPGDVTKIPRASSTPGTPGFIGNSNLILSDAFFYDASYTRLKTTALSCLLSEKVCQKIKLSQVKLYINGQNLLTVKKQVNLNDPETLQGGIPPLRTIVFGMNVTF